MEYGYITFLTLRNVAFIIVLCHVVSLRVENNRDKVFTLLESKIDMVESWEKMITMIPEGICIMDRLDCSPLYNNKELLKILNLKGDPKDFEKELKDKLLFFLFRCVTSCLNKTLLKCSESH